jgi:hypothetical protein
MHKLGYPVTGATLLEAVPEREEETDRLVAIAKSASQTPRFATRPDRPSTASVLHLHGLRY